MTTRDAYETPGAPRTRSPYSQAVSIGNLVAVSGQVGLNPETGELVGDQIEEQTDRALKNLEACLEAAGASMDSVLRVGVFLAIRGDFTAMNTLYGEAFAEPRPARTTVFTGLGVGMLIEIDAIAVKE